MPVSSQITVWYSKIAWRTPWLISGWYGVYAVRNWQPEPHDPALAVGVLVDGLGGVDDLVIHLEHLAGERSDHVGHGLDGLDLAVGGAGRDGGALGRLLVVHELAERVLREPGDPE